ncbi:MAG TPA: DegT/DnrJ/EryC1/StrS family aminotransferase [Coriobacteriia bacterium]|jgi:dTDP-4-amino-4,6-dideoxygalactose transaminase
MEIRVPLFDLDYDEREEEAVLAVLRSKWLTMGDRTAEFEERFAASAGSPHAVAVANCTAALHLAVRVLGIGPGDEVIVPDLTFVATANCVLYEGAVPVLADVVGFNDLTLDPAEVRRKITPRTKAVIVMHYAGFPCRMDEVTGIAREHGLAVIEDCAHAPGGTFGKRALGTIGDVGCFSFFSNKNLSTGEGGMLTCADPDVAGRLRLLRSHCMTAQTLDRHKGHAWGYDVVDVGYNYRLTEIEAALGIVQLAKLPEANAARRRWVERYRDRLAEIPGVVVPFAGFEAGEMPQRGKSAYHLMEILLPEGASQQTVAEKLAERGVQTSVHYRPLHTFSSPKLANAPAEGLEKLDAIAPRLLTLPLYPTMGEERVDYVCEALAEAV